MRDWIVGLQKAASEQRAGASPDDLARIERELSVAFPEELRELYVTIGGGDFQGDVSLYPLFADEETTGLLEQSQQDLPGLPSTGLVRFGLRGGAEHLFAVLHKEMTPLIGETGGWMAAVPKDGWIYGVKNLDTGGVRFFRNLEVMLSELVPPATTEGFGENTFIRAFNAVQSAIEDASGDSEGAPRAAPEKSHDPNIDSRPTAVMKPKVKPIKKASPAGASAANERPGAVEAPAPAPVAAAPAKPKPAAAKKPAARKPAAKKKPAAAAKKPAAKRAAPKKAAKSATRRAAPKKAAAAKRKAPARKTAKAAPKKAAKRAAPKKAAARKPAKRATKKPAKRSR